MKTFTLNDLLVLLVTCMFGSVIFLVLFGSRIPFTEPKFKFGDCIADKDRVGEFTITKGSWFYLIKKIGKKSYLTEVYRNGSLINDNSETSIGITDWNSQIVDPLNCKTME